MNKWNGEYLILGDGLLGSEIQKQTGWDYCSRKKNGLDFNSVKKLETCVYNYHQIINCIAYTNTYDKNKEPSWTTNFISVMNLVDFLNRNNQKLIHISTDYIYSGSVPFATEEDVPVHSANWYSYSKLLSDAYIQARCRNYLLIRCSFKKRPFPYEKAITTQEGNFDYVNKIAEIIIKLIENNASGVYNVGNPQMRSIYDLALETNPDVKPWNDILDDSMPTDITMNVSKMINFLEKINDQN